MIMIYINNHPIVIEADKERIVQIISNLLVILSNSQVRAIYHLKWLLRLWIMKLLLPLEILV